jgi:hypothetical protein
MDSIKKQLKKIAYMQNLPDFGANGVIDYRKMKLHWIAFYKKQRGEVAAQIGKKRA